MGAPKQKWTAEEEHALKAGIKKHGAGKWRTILKDPEFSSILSSRSNVDLKDKWRNMCVVINGFGSREKARVALKKGRNITNHHDDSMALSNELAEYNSDEIVGDKPLAMSLDAMPAPNRTHEKAKLENLILEAITNLKEPDGSDKLSIAMYIEDQYEAPPNFSHLLYGKLKRMTESGKLIKVKHKYRVASSQSFSEGRNPNILLIEGKRREPSRIKKPATKYINKPQVDSELARIRNMNIEEATAYVAQLVVEAEIAMTEAEEATREAEVAEADAEEAKAFVETLKLKNAANTRITIFLADRICNMRTPANYIMYKSNGNSETAGGVFFMLVLPSN